MTGLNQAQDVSPNGGVGTTPMLLVAAQENRKILIIQNVSLVNMGISLSGDTPAVTVGGLGGIGTLVLPPGGGLVLEGEKIPANAINVVAASGSANPITVIQW